MNTLEIDSIIHTYGTKKILTDIYFSCRTGEIVGLLGRNGAGKSTLLKIIFGSLNPRSKNIRINKTPYPALFKAPGKVSYLPQENYLPPDCSVKKCITMMIPDKKSRSKLLADKRIQDVIKRKIRLLSGGELRYVQVMLLAALETEFLLLDEPFSAIEPIYKEVIKERISQISRTRGVIVTDHDYRHVLDICEKVIIIKNGKNYEVKDKTELVQFGYIPQEANRNEK